MSVPGCTMLAKWCEQRAGNGANALKPKEIGGGLDMRRMHCLLVMFALVCSVPVRAGESYHVVKVKDWNRNTTYAVMTESQLQEALRAQQKLAAFESKAADLAKEAWRLDETYGKKPFPQKVLTPPTYTKMGTFNTMDAAETRCQRSQDNQREEDAAEIKAKKSRKQKANPREAAREAESESRQIAARSLFEAKLRELMSDATAAKPAAGEAKPAGAVKPAGH